jgi:molybdate/tungstate transport system substrate-binding protein
MKRTTAILITFVSILLGQEKVIVFHAGSLSVPFAQIEKAFEAKNPQYDVVREAAGSRACARKITDIKKPADVMASADYKVIDNLLIHDFAKFNAHFATNEMVIAYTSHSKYANEINSKNWPEILLRKGVKVGHSNPNLDPCGYRSMLVTKLAEEYYRKPGFFKQLFGYGEHYENGKENKQKVIVRPKETDLLALLEGGAFDYLYIYRSVAQQHGLKYVELPRAVNLGSADEAERYAKVRFEVTGKKPGEWITKKGAPMVYGITIVDNGTTLPPHPKGAKAFLHFLLSPEGMQIIEANGQGVIRPPVVTGDASRLGKQ